MVSHTVNIPPAQQKTFFLSMLEALLRRSDLRCMKMALKVTPVFLSHDRRASLRPGRYLQGPV
jgi:hypothetical protein